VIIQVEYLDAATTATGRVPVVRMLAFLAATSALKVHGLAQMDQSHGPGSLVVARVAVHPFVPVPPTGKQRLRIRPPVGGNIVRKSSNVSPVV